VFQALGPVLERRQHHEQFLIVLIRRDRAVGERTSVPMAFDPVFDRFAHVAAAHEMSVDRMHRAPRSDRAAGRDDRLRHQLAAEGATPHLLRMVTEEDVLADLLEFEQAEQDGEIAAALTAGADRFAQ
jgi:hypothetical protein